MSQVGRIGGGVLKANIEINENNAGKNFLNFKNTGADTAVLHIDPITSRIGINMENPSRDVEAPTKIRSTHWSSDVAELPNFTIDGNITNNIGPTTTISSAGNIRSSSIAVSGIEIDDNKIMSRQTDQDIIIQVGTNERVRSYADIDVYGNVSAEAVTQPDFDIIIEEVQKIVSGDISGFLYPFLTSVAGNGFQYGDINNDGSITASDVTAFARWRSLGDQNLTHMKDHFIPDLLTLQGTYPDAIDAGGKIQFTGNLTFGDDITEDTIAFGDEIRSDIVPDLTDSFKLGSESKRWSQIWSSNLETSNAIVLSDLIVDGISMAKRMGNTFYVATTGDDNNTGDHPKAPVRTIGAALAKCDASVGGPVTVVVNPGTYQETLPLELPPNVVIRGDDIRNCVIIPESGSEYEDVFLLDGETGVENLTIKNFYYDSGTNKGHAFRFKSGGTVTSRSPYVRNVTVITQGSVITADDPRGFNEGDAGRGAWIDGSELSAISRNAALLFHAATFITPGVDAITMTNGVRVEWLNSFTYFANKGLYAVNGVTGRVSTDGSTVEYGAEIRSIGSANVYGNVGAEANGNNCLMYLIGHNFAYVGSGKNVENDETTTDVTQIALQLNGGKIYYNSTEQNGNFRVGDTFFVDFQNGNTSVDTSNINFDGLNSLTLQGANSRTVLSSEKIDVGNLRLSGNTLFSLSGDLNIDSIEGNINLQNDVNISKDLDITGNFTIDGTLITFGNQFQDTVKFNVDINQNFNPDDDTTYMLGNSNYRWNNAHLSQAEIDGIQIFDNIITTKDSNSNLELLSNSSGVVGLENVTVRDTTISTYPIPGADSSIADSHLNLNIDGDFLDIQATGLVLPNGTTSQQLRATDDENMQGGLRFNTQTELFEGYGDARISFRGVYSDNQRTSLTAHKTNNTLNFVVNNNLVGQVNAMGLEINGLQSDSILINNNLITTIDSNADLELRRTTNETIRLNGQEYVRDNIFTNDNNAGAMTIYSTDRGFVKFTGNDGVLLPTIGNLFYDDASTATIVSNTVNSSDVFSTTAGGVTVQSAGTGTTNNDGFDTYTHYLFTGSLNTSIETDTYDFSNWLGGSFSGKVIVGSDTNGGERPEQLETLELQFTTDNTNWSTLGTIATGDDSKSWADFEILLGIDAFGEDVPAASGSVQSSEFGSTDNSPNQSFRLNIEDLLGFEPDSATITSVEFRGDFGDDDEYVDVTINGITYRIGETEDIGDSDQWTTSGNLTNVDISASLTEIDFKTGFDVLVSPSSNISFDSVGIGNWWELRFNIDAERDEVIIDTSSVKFRVHETVITSDDNDNFGLTNVTLRTSVEESSSPEIGAIRFNVGTKQEEVYNGSQWIASTGLEEDPVTNEIMEDFTNIWSLTLG